jgi:hydroxymethylglutaryl-CoA reductase (NADPH)
VLAQIAINISLTDPYLRSVTLSIFPPVFFEAVATPVEGQGFFERGENAVGGFLEGWTRRVGDPVISKWIVVILCVSMGLNAWLLNAARHGAMQPLYSNTKSSATDIVTDKPGTKVPTSVPATSAADVRTIVKTSPITLNDSESDDEEKHMAEIKSHNRRVRSISECMQLLTDGRPQDLLDEEVIALTLQKKIPLYALEKSLKNLERAVKIRRAAVCTTLSKIKTNRSSSRVYYYDTRNIWSPI